MTRRSTTTLSTLGLALALAGNTAAAQHDSGGEADNPLESRADIGLVLGGKVGGGIGKPASEFGGTPVLELELQYLLPLSPPIGHSLGIFFSGQFVQPVVEGRSGEPDPRLPGDGSFDYEVTQQAVALSLGLLYRFDVGSDLVMPYGGLGGRMYLLRSEVVGDAGGEAFGENEETQTGFGFLALGGVEIFLGPGALLGELQFGFVPLDAYVLRNTNLGVLTLAAGYRVML